MKYRPDVDGLRALAVMAVLLYHADLGVPGGFVGVDVFFVISGFLITSLIMKDLAAGRFRMVDFWERRVRRIMPAAVVSIAATLVAGWFILLPVHFKDLGDSTLAQALISANLFFWKTSGYFAEASELKPLLHTWSLAVEEQFYLFFPLILCGLAKWKRKSVASAVLVMGVVSFAACVWMTPRNPDAAFYLLPTRAWELLIGAAVSLGGTRLISRRWPAELLAFLGVAAMIAAMLLFTVRTPFPGVAALLPCAGAALMIAANASHLTFAGRIFAFKPVVFLGLISYSLYLWHWPVLVLAKASRIDPLTPWDRVGLLALAILLAVASWLWVETPFRKKKIGRSRPVLFLGAGIATACLAIAGTLIDYHRGVPSRLPPHVAQYAAGVDDRAALHVVTLEDVRARRLVPLGEAVTGDVEVLLWGDSHGIAMMPVFDALCRDHHVRGLAVTYPATPPLLDHVNINRYGLSEENIPFSRAVIDFACREKVKSVILVANWGGYIQGDARPRARAALLETARILNAAGTDLWVVMPVPSHPWEVPDVLARYAMTHEDAEEFGTPATDRAYTEQRLAEVFDGVDSEHLHVVNPAPLFKTTAGMYRVAFNGRALYIDSHHLSNHGAMFIRPALEPIFARLSHADATAVVPNAFLRTGLAAQAGSAPPPSAQ